MYMTNIDQRHIGTVQGFEIDAHLVPDETTNPREYESYTADQVTAWHNEQWCFVGVIVTATRAGIELGSTSLWSVDYGDMPGVESFVNPLHGDGDDFVHGYGPGLISEAIAEARKKLAELNTEGWR